MTAGGIRRARAVFLDRDGTINREVDYLRRVEDLEILPGAAEGVRLLNRAGFKVVVVTNQSGIARGLLDPGRLMQIHQEIQRRLSEKGAAIDAWYYCPHHPEAGPGGKRGPYTKVCRCRKPAPGMIEQAARDLDLDLSSSFMVGDSLRDLETAWASGVRAVLVRTGYGSDTLARLRQAGGKAPDFVAEDLLEAANWIAAEAKGRQD